ncbi:MAG TPA: hypothetical protein VEB59_03020 [Gemmatimonadales bacterium]|nr:hypothetical protein [Gemmatimonadales bacterium]
MMDPTSPANDADWLSLPLRERVLMRVDRARRAAQSSARPRVQQEQERRAPEGKREARALRRVFLDLGESYREYRTRTGRPVSSEVRDAAYAFQRNRDLDSLVTVAALLDRQESLRW